MNPVRRRQEGEPQEVYNRLPQPGNRLEISPAHLVSSAPTHPPTHPPTVHVAQSFLPSGLAHVRPPEAYPPTFHTSPQVGTRPAPRPPTTVATGGTQQYQKLKVNKVEDALWYLDQVKLQFGDQPHVYNSFLDIMKEFKSQSIDTPGVITRVSNLFKGRPDLICGFNTFLPPGYKIEVRPQDPGSNNHTFNVTLNISPNAPGGQPNRISTFHIISGGGDRGAIMTPVNPVQPPTGPVKPEGPPQPGPQHPHHPQQKQPPRQQQEQKQHEKQQQNGPGPQPEFNQAISYVNKIKTRFSSDPEVYKSFIDILHTFQKEQRNIKEIPNYQPSMGENEVYEKVRVLFKEQSDLLNDFSQFLPEAHSVAVHVQQERNREILTQLPHDDIGPPPLKKAAIPGSKFNSSAMQAPSGSDTRPPKLHIAKIDKEDPIIKGLKQEEEKIIIHSEINFFERVRRAVKSQEVYDNFLRCLMLYNEEIISNRDLVQLVVHFIGKFPELYTWFKEYVGYRDAVPTDEGPKTRLGDIEINFASCKRYGASYRALPANYAQPKCMGRTELCKEVLNDTWVSFSCWSEDSTFLGSKKTQYEEYIFKCEEERFELDIVIETNINCIKQLEAVMKKMSKLTPEELSKFRLDNKLGGTSEVIGKQAIKRIYGDKYPGIIDGLKKNPQAVIPIVLKRLKSKDEEWAESRHQFSKIWNEQCTKYHLKSLDHQSVSFKQTDPRSIRSKILVNEIETLYDERMEQLTESRVFGAHIKLQYRDHHILEDARSLIIHHLRRQSHLQKEEKTKVKMFLNGFLQDFFFAPRGDVSDEESEEESSDDDHSRSSRASNKGGRRSGRKTEKVKSSKTTSTDNDVIDAYNLFYTNNQWYVFMRQHQILCDRLHSIHTHNTEVVEQEMKDRKCRKEPTAQAIRMRQPNPLPVEHYYSHFLSMVKDLLDGNIESSVYEDKLREMFGVNSFIAFTLDKLVSNIVRQSHTLATDTSCNLVKSLYLKQRGQGGAGGSLATSPSRTAAETAYQKETEGTLVEENLYKIYYYKQGQQLTIELLAEETEEETENEIETKTEEVRDGEKEGEPMDTSTR